MCVCLAVERLKWHLGAVGLLSAYLPHDVDDAHIRYGNVEKGLRDLLGCLRLRPVFGFTMFALRNGHTHLVAIRMFLGEREREREGFFSPSIRLAEGILIYDGMWNSSLPVFLGCLMFCRVLARSTQSECMGEMLCCHGIRGHCE